MVASRRMPWEVDTWTDSVRRTPRRSPKVARPPKPAGNTRAWLIDNDKTWNVTPPPRASGITQGLCAPWGFSNPEGTEAQDPLERMNIRIGPTGTPYLQRSHQPRASTVQAIGASDWGSKYYPRSYGGGGGGGYAATVPQSMWWNPGLFNWRYGVTL